MAKGHVVADQRETTKTKLSYKSKIYISFFWVKVISFDQVSE